MHVVVFKGIWATTWQNQQNECAPSEDSVLLSSMLYEPRHDKTNKMSVRPAKTQISLGIRPVWSESLLCAQWVAKDRRFLHAESEDSDQNGRMPRLIWVFTGRTLILLVLSWRGSYGLTLQVTHKFEPPRDKTNKMACAPSEDSDQPGHPPSLIRVFAVRSVGS